MRVGLAADHAGFALKERLVARLRRRGHDPVDFGAPEALPGDDYPDYVLPLAAAVAAGEVERGVAVCGSGVGASIAANRVAGARAAVCHDHYSAHQGVEHDDMNVLCLGARIVGPCLGEELVEAFLAARFRGEARHRRRLEKVDRSPRTRP